MSQKYLAVFAYILRNPEKTDPPICYGMAFCKKDTFSACNEVAEYRCRRLKADLVGLWSCEWHNPNAPYVELFRDRSKHPSDEPGQDLAKMMRTGNKDNKEPDKPLVVVTKPRVQAKPEAPLYGIPYSLSPAVYREESANAAAS